MPAPHSPWTLTCSVTPWPTKVSLTQFYNMTRWRKWHRQKPENILGKLEGLPTAGIVLQSGTHGHARQGRSCVYFPGISDIWHGTHSDGIQLWLSHCLPRHSVGSLQEEPGWPSPLFPELLAVDGDCAYGVCIKSSPDQERDSQDAASFTTESHVYEPWEGR